MAIAAVVGAEPAHLADDGTRAVLRRAVAGQPAAVAMLLQRLAPVIQARVRRYLARCPAGRLGSHEAIDLMQEIWLTLIKDGGHQLLAWDPRRGMSLESYVGMICERDLRHMASRQLAACRAAEVSPGEPLLDCAAPPGETPEGELITRDLLAALEEHLLAALPERGQLILRLLYCDGRTVDEAARTLSVPRQVVYNWQHRIRQMVREFLQQENSAPLLPVSASAVE